MTTIGSTHYSIYSSLNRAGTGSSTQSGTDALLGGAATSRSNVSSSGLSGGAVTNDSGLAKLSDALWRLTSSGDESAADDDVWQDGGDTLSIKEKEFMNLADMNLAELIRAKFLEDNDLKEQDLARMTAEERAKIEDQIAQAIEQALEQQTGSAARQPDETAA